MARGNQRDKAREKNAKELAAKGTKLTGNPQQRREADAAALKAKIDAKAAKAAADLLNPPKPTAVKK